MSLAGLGSMMYSKSSNMKQEEVIKFFTDRANHTFVIKEVRWFAINVAVYSDYVMERAKRHKALFLLPTTWIAAGFHALQKGVAHAAFSSHNAHWFFIMHDVDANEDFVLEFGLKGLNIRAKPEPHNKYHYHLSDDHWTNRHHSRPGIEIEKYLERWISVEYHLIHANCQCFVKRFSEWF